MGFDSVRIAVIEPVGAHGGLDHYDIELCRNLSKIGVDVCLYTSEVTPPPNSVPFTISTKFQGTYGKNSKVISGLRYLNGSLASFCSIYRDRRAIVHFQFFQIGFLEVINILLARILAKRIVITAHDLKSFDKKIQKIWLHRWAYSQADHIIVHNHSTQSELKILVRNPEACISVIPHGNYSNVFPNPPSHDVARYRLSIPKKKKVILFFGQIKEDKCLDLLIDALPFVLKSVPDCTLIIAGRPWKVDYWKYEKKIREYKISEHIESHIRFIPDDEVPFFFAACDLVALPYRKIYQSGILLLAMSLKKAVCVSNIPGMLDLIEGGKNGFVFQAGNVKSLSDTLRTALLDNELRKKVAHQGYIDMQEKHNWINCAAATKKIYECIVIDSKKNR